MLRAPAEIPLPASLRRGHPRVRIAGESSIPTQMRSPDSTLSEQRLLSFPGVIVSGSFHGDPQNQQRSLWEGK